MNTEPTVAVEQKSGLDRTPRASVGEVMDAFHGVRAAVADLFNAVGVDPTKSRDSARVLRLNRGLAWRLTRIVRSSENPAAVSDLPGRQGVSQFISACRDLGAPEPALRTATDAIDRFERLVSSCSGDRKTLAMLLANRHGGNAHSERERARRTLFEGACSVWGAQAQTRFVTVFLFPSSSDPSRLDAGHVTGYVGFRRLSGRPWPMSYEAVHDTAGAAQVVHKRPLDPSGVGEGQLQLLTPFCSPERPPIEVRQGGGYKIFELAEGPVGNQGLTTCVFGSYLQEIYERYSDTGETAGFMVLLRTPVERVMFDYFVHKDLGAAVPARTHLLDRLAFPHDNRVSEFERQSLPISETPVMLHPGASGGVTPHIPWYPRLLGFVSERLGIPLEDFEGSRFEMNYPPISTTLSRRIDLPAAPR